MREIIKCLVWSSLLCKTCQIFSSTCQLSLSSRAPAKDFLIQAGCSPIKSGDRSFLSKSRTHHKILHSLFIPKRIVILKEPTGDLVLRNNIGRRLKDPRESAGHGFIKNGSACFFTLFLPSP